MSLVPSYGLLAQASLYYNRQGGNEITEIMRHRSSSWSDYHKKRVRIFLLWWLIPIRNLIFFSYVSSLVLFLYALPELCLISWNLNSVKWWFIQLWYYLDSVFLRCLLIPSALQPNSLVKIRWANCVLNTEFIFLPKITRWPLLTFFRT